MAGVLELLQTLLHLWGWCQLGVLTRIYITQLFGGACSPHGSDWWWVPCVTSDGLTRYGGAVFEVLPANVLGSFVMGFFASADVIAAGLAVKGHGTAVACLPNKTALQKHTPLHIGVRTGFCGSLTTYSTWVLQTIEMLVAGPPSEFRTQWVESLWALFIGIACSMCALAFGQQLALYLHLQVWNKDNSPNNALVGDGSPGNVQVSLATNEQAPSEGKLPCWLADALALLFAGGLTAASIVMAIIDDSGQYQPSRQYYWFSILFGPFGAIIRWKLSDLNGKVPGSWSWFPLGTFIANQLACTLDFGLQVLVVRDTSMTALQVSVVKGWITGFSGSLSTVSTWVVEIQKLTIGFPKHLHSYLYIALSLGVSWLIGILLYGIPIWTM